MRHLVKLLPTALLVLFTKVWPSLAHAANAGCPPCPFCPSDWGRVGLGSGLAIQHPRLDVCYPRHSGRGRAIAGHVTVRGCEAEAKTTNLDIGGHKSAGRSHQKDGDAGGVE